MGKAEESKEGQTAINVNSSVCPNCGHCPTCGRSNSYPYVWPQPYQVWWNTTTGVFPTTSIITNAL